MIAQEFSRYDLKAIPVRETMPHLTHSLLTRRGSPPTAAAKYFFECFERTKPAAPRK